MQALRSFRLDSDEDTLVFVSRDGAMPELSYWGPRLPADDLALPERGIPHGMLDTGERLSLLPEAGRGFFGHPGIVAHRKGRDFVTQFALSDVRQEPTRLVFALADRVAGLALELTVGIDKPTGGVSALVSVTNLGEDG